FLPFGRHESDVGASAADAGVPGEALGVIAEAELTVGGMVAAVGGNEVGFPVAFETGAGNYVEGSVSPVAIFGGLPATLNFDSVNILGVELRANICRDVGVGNWNAIQEPGDLVAAADVKLVMNHIRAGSVADNEVQAVGARCAGKFSNFGARDGCGRAGRSGINPVGIGLHFDLLANADKFEREMPQRSGVRGDEDDLFEIAKAFARNVERIFTGGNGIDFEAAFCVSDGGALPIGLSGAKFNFRALNWVMLNVVNDAAHSAKDAGVHGC